MSLEIGSINADTLVGFVGYSADSYVGTTYIYAIDPPHYFSYEMPNDVASYVGSSSMSAFISIERSAELIVAGVGSSSFNPGGSIWQGAMTAAGVGSFSLLASAIYQSQRLIAGGNGAILFLGSRFFEDNSVLVQGFGDTYFFGGWERSASVVLSGIAQTRFFAAGKIHSGGEFILNGVADAVFQALIQTGGFQVPSEFYKVHVVDDRDLRYLTMQDIRLVLPQHSRYKFNEVLLARDVVMLSPFRASSFLPDVSDLVYETAMSDEGRLDLISFRMYGTGSLWWVLALLNNIRDPFSLPVSTSLRIPTHDRILRELMSSNSRRS